MLSLQKIFFSENRPEWHARGYENHKKKVTLMTSAGERYFIRRVPKRAVQITIWTANIHDWRSFLKNSRFFTPVGPWSALHDIWFTLWDPPALGSTRCRNVYIICRLSRGWTYKFKSYIEKGRFWKGRLRYKFKSYIEKNRMRFKFKTCIEKISTAL